MKKLLILAIFLPILSACDNIPSSENKAKKIVSAVLIDPDSAKFESISPGLKEGGFCGYVNGKNRMGGYAGASPFIVNVQTSEVEIGDKPVEKDDFQQYDTWRKLERHDKTVEVREALRKRCGFPMRWEESCKEQPKNKTPMLELCALLVDPPGRIPANQLEYVFMDEVSKAFK